MTQEADMQAVSSVYRSIVARLPLVRPEGGVDDVSPSRALVPVLPVTESEFPRTQRYPTANFLAHLIAVRQRSPQTRRRGRATPDEAATAYAAARAMPVRLGAALKKSA
jgi:hypothetical protein